ncbi:MAG: undecaprenyl-diphosphate phosphatase [Clostridia bacterium]|nr:undecaprenyl-diphosphate phosphatase [Clostridia bacterium]
MGITEAVVYGLIQGVAEFLPVSSSGHLALAQNFFGAGAQSAFAFNVLLHLATLASVCLALKEDVSALIKGAFSFAGKLFALRITKTGLTREEKLFCAVFVSALPLIPAKLLGLDVLCERICGSSAAVGAMLIFNGVMLLAADRMKKGRCSAENGGAARAFGVGAVQATLGVLPGISRSGSTVAGARFFGYAPEEAVRLSFLMSLPAIAGACVSELPEALGEAAAPEILPCVLGAFTAGTVGFAAVKLLQYMIKNKSLGVFAVYTAAVGAAALIADTVFS